MPSVRDILQGNGISLRDERAGQHTAICPKCSADRKPANRRKRVLSVLVDHEGLTWYCHHCSWHGGQYFDHRGERKGPARKASPSGGYAQLQRGARSQWK